MLKIWKWNVTLTLSCSYLRIVLAAPITCSLSHLSPQFYLNHLSSFKWAENIIPIQYLKKQFCVFRYILSIPGPNWFLPLRFTVEEAAEETTTEVLTPDVSQTFGRYDFMKLKQK